MPRSQIEFERDGTESALSRIRRMTAQPAAAALLTLLLAVVGAMGSAFSTEIRASVLAPCPPWQSGCELDILSTIFWIALICTAAFFWMRQREIDLRRSSHEAALKQRTDELRDLVLTMPPTDFLVRFSERFELCEALVAAALSTDGEDRRLRLIEGAQAVLLTVAELAQSFDGSEARYAANIMMPLDTGGLEAEAAEQLLGRIRMREPDTTLSSFDIVLALRPDLSAAFGEETPDCSVGDLVLGVPRTPKTIHHDWRVLPGACRAYVERQPNMVIDTTRIVDELRTGGRFSDDVLEEARKYFSSDAGRLIQSFLSVPIFEPRTTSQVTTKSELQVLSILNLHRDRPGMLRIDPTWAPPERSLEQFLPVLDPFSRLLARLLVALREAEIAGGTPR